MLKKERMCLVPTDKGHTQAMSPKGNKGPKAAHAQDISPIAPAQVRNMAYAMQTNLS